MSDQERPCGCLFKGYEVVSQCIYHTGRQNLIESLEKFRHDAKVENAELHSQIESIQRENEELKADNEAKASLIGKYSARLEQSESSAITPEMRERIERKLADMQAESPLPIGGELVDLLRDLLGEQG